LRGGWVPSPAFFRLSLAIAQSRNRPHPRIALDGPGGTKYE
jgi:hypothetical protein